MAIPFYLDQQEEDDNSYLSPSRNFFVPTCRRCHYHHHFENQAIPHHPNRNDTTRRQTTTILPIPAELLLPDEGDLFLFSSAPQSPTHDQVSERYAPQLQEQHAINCLRTEIVTSTSVIEYKRKTSTTSTVITRCLEENQHEVIGQGHGRCIGAQLRAIADSYKVVEQQKQTSKLGHVTNTSGESDDIVDSRLVTPSSRRRKSLATTMDGKLLRKATVIVGLLGFTVGVICSTKLL